MNPQYAIVVSNFNEHITSKLLEGALAQFKQANVASEDIKIAHVPGAVEIPLTAKMLAKQKKFAAIVCLGAVIRGETGHYDFVCEQVSQGCQRVMLDYEVPVIFGVLTTENNEQAYDRVGGKHGHKGKEAALAAMDMVKLLREIG